MQIGVNFLLFTLRVEILSHELLKPMRSLPVADVQVVACLVTLYYEQKQR